MNNKTLALTIIGASIVAPLTTNMIANEGGSIIVANALEDEKEERLIDEKTEQAKLDILKNESELAKKRLVELERKKSVTFNSNDIRVLSNLNTNEIKKLLEGTNMEALAPAFIDAEKVYGINALALAGLVANESSWNTSRRALEQNNLTGYAVYSDSSNGKDFNSPYGCIMETARLLKQDYLSDEGKWHNGYSLQSINIMYSSDNNWYNTIENIADNLLDEYKENTYIEMENLQWTI